MNDDQTFQNLHPYGFTTDQMNIALWLLFTILMTALMLFVYSVWSKVRTDGPSLRSFMGMKQKTDKQQRQERAEIKRIVEKQRKNRQD